ncbi:hypothetical protein GPROT1_01627 [Gammaproteobacteria bacterium]|nr:hypothetical protein GPROT1_01627 [Gammaproteobacteria bacterium]
MTTIRIDRAPVLAMWASVVAERLGWPHETALTLGQAVADMTTRATDDRLGTHAQSGDRPLADVTDALREVPLLGQIVHVASTPEGPRAVSKNALLEPDAVARYLRDKFGNQLCAALTAMERLAATMSTDALNEEAFRFYEHFRPDAPSGVSGAEGILDLGLIHALVRTRSSSDHCRLKSRNSA